LATDLEVHHWSSINPASHNKKRTRASNFPSAEPPSPYPLRREPHRVEPSACTGLESAVHPDSDDHFPGPRADVWALGVIFYEILVGQHPFLPPCLRSPTSFILPSTSPAAGAISPKPSPMMSKKEEGILIWRICEMDCPALPVTPANARLVASRLFRAALPRR